MPPLYAIVDEEQTHAAGRRPVEVAEAFLRAGVTWLQLRAKRAGSAELLVWATAIARLAAQRDARFVVNDRADLARLVGAGVHLGQDDLPPKSARVLLGEAAMVGLSTHTVTQVEDAIGQPISYLAVGPVFGTRTKRTGYEPVGFDLVRAAVARVGGRLPVVAIGGITIDRAPDVLAAGATAVAVIGDLLIGDPEARARAWIERLAGRGDRPVPGRSEEGGQV